MNEIALEDRNIGPGERTLVIAEIGVNHDGKLDNAIALVRQAAACGADAVKLQVFRVDSLMHGSAAFAAYQMQSAAVDATPTEMLRKYELSDDDLSGIVWEIRHLRMIPLATPFSLADVARIEMLGLPAIKIASPDVVNWPLLRRASRSGRPLLVSVGAADINEISSAVAWLRGWPAPFVLLHCISSYPTPGEEANLCWISELAQRFDVPIGFSDHTVEVCAGAMAVAAGACVVEKHITLDRAAPGPDHAASCDAGQFEDYVRLVRIAESMRGAPGKRVLEIERDVRKVSRQSLVAARDIAPGQRIHEEDLTIQRPGTGIPAAAMPAVIGRRAAGPIRAGQMLTWRIINDAA